MRDPKLNIKKKKILNKQGHYRFYTVEMLRLDETEIKTEKELLWYIYQNHGDGEYLLIGHAKGKKGCWVFWRGDITEQGFLFYKKRYNRKAVEEWDELKEGDDDPEIDELKEETKREEKEKAKKKRYGFEPFLKPSGRRGEFRFWDQDEFEVNAQQDQIEDWGQFTNESKSNLEDWGKPTKSQELEQWE